MRRSTMTTLRPRHCWCCCYLRHLCYRGGHRGIGRGARFADRPSLWRGGSAAVLHDRAVWAVSSANDPSPTEQGPTEQGPRMMGPTTLKQRHLVLQVKRAAGGCGGETR
jgi:hypothetical protein